MNKKIIIKFRLFLWLMLFGVLAWLLYMGVVPGGKITYRYDFSGKSQFIGKLTPADRLEAISTGAQKIIGDPVYFSLFTPRRFNKARLILKYRASDGVKLIEAGVLADKVVWRYDLKPIENKIIDQLALVWNVTREDGLILLQKDKKFSGVKDFLANLPERNEIALYNYNLKQDYILNNYLAAKEINSTPALRGAYQFYTYLKNEDLDFKFTIIDLNLNKDSDPVEINLYYGDDLISSRHLDDDGTAGDSGNISSERELSFYEASLPEGAYKIEVRTNDDIITERIETPQSRLAFINKLWLYRAGKNGLELFTDSRSLQLETINPASRQIVKAGEEEINIDETYKQFNLALKGATTTEISVARDGLVLAGDGVFSFEESGLINPGFKRITPDLNIGQEGVNYVLAGYETPLITDDWREAVADFDLSNSYREKGRYQLGSSGKYSFILSIPGLRVDDEIADWAEISEIKIELAGTSLAEKIRKIIGRD